MRRFAHRLALRLGWWDVDALLDAMPRRALLDWIAYHELEPWDEARADARAAIVAATVANVAPRRTPRRFRVEEFLAHREAPARREMPAAKRALFGAMMRAAGAREVVDDDAHEPGRQAPGR